jgi:hypothetical protein
MIKLGQILTMKLFPDISFQEVVQPMQIAAPGCHEIKDSPTFVEIGTVET